MFYHVHNQRIRGCRLETTPRCRNAPPCLLSRRRALPTPLRPALTSCLQYRCSPHPGARRCPNSLPEIAHFRPPGTPFQVRTPGGRKPAVRIITGPGHVSPYSFTAARPGSRVSAAGHLRLNMVARPCRAAGVQQGIADATIAGSSLI